MSWSIPEIHRQKDIVLGSGLLFLGEANTPFNELELESMGCIEANITANLIANKVEYTAGSPAVLITKEISLLGAKITASLSEIGLAKLRKAMGGLGNYSSVNAQMVSHVEEEIKLYGNNFFHLQGIDIVNVAEVKSDEFPPQIYNPNDYEIHQARGLIRRREGGNIPEGSTVLVTYDWNRPNMEVLGLGIPETCSAYYPLRVMFPKCDQSRLFIDLWKVFADNDEYTLNLQRDEWTNMEVTFTAAADSSKVPEQALGRIIKEFKDEVSSTSEPGPGPYNP